MSPMLHPHVRRATMAFGRSMPFFRSGPLGTGLFHAQGRPLSGSRPMAMLRELLRPRGIFIPADEETLGCTSSASWQSRERSQPYWWQWCASCTSSSPTVCAAKRSSCVARSSGWFQPASLLRQPSRGTAAGAFASEPATTPPEVRSRSPDTVLKLQRRRRR